MKKITLVIVLLLSFFANAQQPFPEAHPEILQGKKVKVILTSLAKRMGYDEFYADEAMSKVYSPRADSKHFTDPEALAGKVFDIVSVKPAGITWQLTLKAEDGTLLYHRYTKEDAATYAFDVVGGLTLPDGFYCDHVKEVNEGGSTKLQAITGDGTTISKSDIGAESAYILTVAAFFNEKMEPLKNIVIVLDGGKTITVAANVPVTAQPHGATSFRYSGVFLLSAKDIAVLKTTKVAAFKFGTQTSPFKAGEKLKGVINCLSK